MLFYYNGIHGRRFVEISLLGLVPNPKISLFTPFTLFTSDIVGPENTNNWKVWLIHGRRNQT